MNTKKDCCEHECHEVNEQYEHCSWCITSPQGTDSTKNQTTYIQGDNFFEGGPGLILVSFDEKEDTITVKREELARYVRKMQNISQGKESSEEVTDEELDYALGHVESSEEKMRKGAKLFARDFTGVMKELAEESEPSFTEKALSEFRKIWKRTIAPNRGDLEQWLTSKLEETWDHGFAEGYNASTEDHTDSTHNMHSESAHAPPSTQKEEGIVQERARTLAIIEKHKEDSRSDGSFKHDDCYDSLKEEIEK